MGVFWGLVVAAAGVLLAVWARAESEFVVYRLLVARSRLLWKERVHVFHQVAGALMVVAGLLIAVI